MKLLHLMISTVLAIVILAGCSKSSGPDYVTGPQGTGEISFRRDVLPIFNNNGCTGCHGGNGGLVVSSVGALLAGGDHGSAIIPSDADASLLIKKLSTLPPFGSRMPLGGPYLSDETVEIIREWINEGAKDN